MLRLALLAATLPATAAHARLLVPPRRPHSQGPAPGIKLRPFREAEFLANSGCGGLDNHDPGVQRPRIAYMPGVDISVAWTLEIAHPADVLDTGVRIAIHYSEDDSFASNVLRGTLDGGHGALAAHGPDDTAGAVISTTVRLPDKTCDYCTLQFIWAARADGGSYIGCADVSITPTGDLPDFDVLPSQEGNVLNGVAGDTWHPDQAASDEVCPHACLLFSAYVEGSSNNKLIDVQNRCTEAVDLAAWSLVKCSNGCTQWEHTEHLGLLHGTHESQMLPAGATWRIAHPQAAISAILSYSNATYAYLSNGDDAFGLRHVDGTVSDTVGEIGPDPGSGWDVAGVSHATKDHTLVRKPTVLHGTCGVAGGWERSAGTSAESSEWRVYPKNSIPGVAGGGEVEAPPQETSACEALVDCPEPTGVVAIADGRHDKTRLKVASWNAEWLFDGVCDPSVSPWHPGSTSCVGLESALNACDEAGAAAKLQRAQEVVSRVGVDVMNLVEVEGCAALDGLASTDAALQRYLLTGTDTFLKQQVSVWARGGVSARACGGVWARACGWG